MTVIFDLDGTLVNSLYDLGDSVNEALSQYSLPLRSYDEYRMFVGNGTKLLVSRSVPSSVRDTEIEKAVFERFSALYEQNCLRKTKPYDGIIEAVCELKKSGAMLAVASNKPRDFCCKIVEALFGAKTFDVIEGSRDGVRKKPYPDIIMNIIARLEADKDKCVIVGDSDVDVETAKNSGMRCVGCSWGFRDRSVLESAGCDIIIDTPSELPDAVRRLMKIHNSANGR